MDLNKHNYNSQYNKFSILKCQLLSQNNRQVTTIYLCTAETAAVHVLH